MNSDISSWISASSLPNMKLASALVSSVLPTPVGPRNMNEPIGRARVFQPGARAADGFGDGGDGFFLPDDMLASARLPSAAGAADSSCAICITGTPVHMETTSAISSAVTSGLCGAVPAVCADVSICRSSAFSLSAQFDALRHRGCLLPLARQRF